MKQELKYLVTIGIILLMSINYYSCKCTDCDDDPNPILTVENERNLGNKLYQFIVDNPNIYPSFATEDYPEMYYYLDMLMFNVATTTQVYDKYDWQALILDDDASINVFALPGGKIIITSGMLRLLTEGSQLISVLAHEAYYTDREDRNTRDDLSKVMDKLKKIFLASTGLGTSVFIDIIEDNSDLSTILAVINTAKNEISYDYTVVQKADSLAIQMLCHNYVFAADGTLDIIMMAENNPNLDIIWLDNRPPSSSNFSFPSNTIQTRQDFLNTQLLEVECVNNLFQGNENYQDYIVNQLP